MFPYLQILALRYAGLKLTMVLYFILDQLRDVTPLSLVMVQQLYWEGVWPHKTTLTLSLMIEVWGKLTVMYKCVRGIATKPGKLAVMYKCARGIITKTVPTACPQVFSSGGTCTLLPSFLGVQCTPLTLFIWGYKEN